MLTIFVWKTFINNVVTVPRSSFTVLAGFRGKNCVFGFGFGCINGPSLVDQKVTTNCKPLH